MRILISGASGLIGRSLAESLRAAGHTVQTLVRRKPKESEGEIAWDPEAGVLDYSRLDGVDVVVHLAGKPIDLRWTEATKKSILDSRVKGTRLLAQTAASPPRACSSTRNAPARAISATSAVVVRSPSTKNDSTSYARLTSAAIAGSVVMKSPSAPV